jgi:signal transduction histidine kinase
MQAMTLLICGLVLLVVIASLFAFQVISFRSTFQRDTTTLSVVIANNSAAAMAFRDEQAAGEVVGALQAKSTVLSATLVLPDGAPFAHFGRPEARAALALFPPPGQSGFRGGHMLLTQPVLLKADHVGTLYLRTDYHRTFMELLKFYCQVVAAVVLVATGLGFLLSSRLSRTLTEPVQRLAQTAKVFGEKKDYSIRAVVDRRGDELGHLAEAFNEMLSRIQAQDAALSLSQQKMEALINSIDGIVWERNPETFQFTFISRQSETILGYAPQAWLAQPDFWAEKLHPLDAAKALQNGRDLAARGQPYSHEYRMLAADERVVWVRESGTVLAENGKPVALRGILLDITRQKLDAEQLDNLNRQLIDTSRQAGMAEVASGVLHNVGNVLNSVGVAATVVSKRLRDSKVANLRRATAMLREHNGPLAAFLTNDPKGKLLPEYLGSVADQLAEEQGKLAEKMESVARNIEHIKEIVAMQQSYAKVSGAYEQLAAADLVEDALRINSAAFDRHGIELVRQFEPNLPPICADRHKVLQILINLLRNAKHAMEGMRKEDKRLVIRISQASAERITISLRDNGVGIPPENLNRIFNHGFTTKKNGHGFGLHSGANAAKEMGGSLSGHSDGPAKGAEFILELPTRTQPRLPQGAAAPETLEPCPA